MAGWLDGLRRTRDRFSGILKEAFASGETAGEPDETTLEDLHDLLITADLPPLLAERLVQEIQHAAKRHESPRQAAKRILTAELAPPENALPADWATLPAPGVILLVGINGSGKTTTAAKLAHHAKAAGRRPLLGAADTYRAAGSHQLRLWAEKLDIPAVIGETGADAAAVAFDSLKATIARGCDTLILDTAGRMHTREPLMKELPKLRSALAKQCPEAPHRTWLVLDAMLGQNALSQARQFHQTTPLDGVIVTKLDGSSKAGFLFAIKREMNLPILYAGLGESAEDLTPFSADAFVDALLGLD